MRPAAASATNPPAIVPDPYGRRRKSADAPFGPPHRNRTAEVYHIPQPLGWTKTADNRSATAATISPGGLSLSRRPIGVENQADGVRALARRYRRRIAPAVRFQCVADRPRVT